MVPAAVDQNAYSIVHDVGGVSATFIEFSCFSSETLPLFGGAVPGPHFIEVLTCVETTSVSTDKPDLSVDLGCSVASTRGRPIDNTLVVIVWDLVLLFFFLERHLPLEVGRVI